MRRLLAFGTFDLDRHPRARVLLEGLSSTWQVASLNRPLGFSTAERVRMLEQPWRLGGFAARLAGRWLQLAAGSLRYRGDRAPDALLVGYMGHFDVLLARLLFPRTVIALDHLIFAAGTARDRRASGRVLHLVLSALDRAALAAADVLIMDTDEHARQLRPRERRRALVVPVGAPARWYRLAQGRHGSRDADAPLSIVFFGLFTPLQGTPVIAAALRRLHDDGVAFRATLIGTGQDAERCREILEGVDEVTWVPWLEGADLAETVADHDVCLGIMGSTPKGLDVVPNKVYQGLAAGCAVVTSDTPPQRRVLGDAVDYAPPGDAAALAAVLARLSREPAARRALQVRGRARADELRGDRLVQDLDDRLRRRG
ncbi:glycosyltransferase [Brachybacterium huguangmaarense]|uniref:Glycosyltransferase n=1 Tax=Brachybacterium huguangmaarense TaxID=1652028 RepID=A0ABY6G483_9MICO|nr:glycosyltransferase [Brachybacterium huguangmaarense]UYG17927.1 glycosyltransferase [Brachybacterium huguangmaarense]